MFNRRLLSLITLALIALPFLLAATGPLQAKDTPGVVPPGAGHRSVKDPQSVLAATGLNVFYRRFGKFRISVDAAGSNNAAHTILVRKPFADAVVDKAYLMAASNFVVTIANGDIKLDGQNVSWISSVYNDVTGYPNFFHNVLGDVTAIVKPKVDAVASAGNVSFSVSEVNKNTFIDGEILVVVFRTPSVIQRRTVALLFGGQQLSGDQFELTFLSPIDPAAPGARLDFGLGISFSYCCPVTPQYSIVDVNSSRLSTAAGGQDDGADFNGALITAGGIGDSRANPPVPTAIPTSVRSDDELYNLLPFITKTTTLVRVDTSNPSNDDNILFAWFDMTANAEVNKDTDGDGLLDTWEISGYDHDGDGTVDVPIHMRGANYRHKDIFIAYAWMQASGTEVASHRPSAGVLGAITTAFANAPVTNPNGVNGITVHWRNRGGVPHDADLNPAWTEFDAIMNPLVSEAERKIYHRLLNGHQYDGGTSSGLSRGIPASDFIETLGGFPSNPGTFRERAGTIMHELGHNLGLRHGGVDHENYKPNHLSIMSYANQLVWLLKGGVAKLDYERFDLRGLDEASLSEPAGLNRVGGDGPISTYGVRWYNGGVSMVKNTGANANVDWNNSGAATETGLVIDLNNSGGTGLLLARYPEWTNIAFDGGDIGAGLASGKANLIVSPADLIELTYEEYVRMQKNVVQTK